MYDFVEKDDLQAAYIYEPGKWGFEVSQGTDNKLAESLYSLSEKLIREKAGDDSLLDWEEIKP